MVNNYVSYILYIYSLYIFFIIIFYILYIILDKSQLHYQRPFDRGYLIDYNIEELIFNRLFSKQVKEKSYKQYKQYI